MLHEFENNDDTQSFLKQNGKKFAGDCLIAMILMYQGIRLNGDTCKELYGISDRRLRNCREGRPDIVKSEWKRNESGKRLYVEYFISGSRPPTKKEVCERSAKAISDLKEAEKHLVTVFELQDDPPIIKQGNLFP